MVSLQRQAIPSNRDIPCGRTDTVPHRDAHRRGAAALTSLVVAAVLALSGCSSVDPHVYDTPRAVATQLDASSAGPVLYTGTYGTGGFSSDKPTLIYVYSGADGRKTLEARMRELGYTESTVPGAWTPTGHPLVAIRLVDLPSGASYVKGAGHPGVMPQDGFELAITDTGVSK